MKEEHAAAPDERSLKELSCLGANELYQRLDTGLDGLTSNQVKERKAKYGSNTIESKKKESQWLKFLKNFTSLMAILLWFGGAIAFFFTDTPQLGIAIWLVNVINGLFSYFQESRASKATEALKKMLPSYARVIREGKEEQILAEELVPGDVLLIEEGDRISADARVIQATDLQVNQSALTGESNPIRKNDEVQSGKGMGNFELKNMIFAGTTVSNGSARAVVSQIGMQTEFGKIADLTQSLGEEKSPLQMELDKLTKQISVIAILIGVVFFFAAIFFVHQPVAQGFIFALGMIVAFIPEGLLPTVTLSLAMAVQRMAQEHALVKKLSSVETLGATSVICSDKTGTLTQNEMTVCYAWTASKEYQVGGLGYAPQGTITVNGQQTTGAQDPELAWLLRAASLCSNARVLPPDDENPRYRVLGDPTEACLNVVAQKAGLDLAAMVKENPRLRELPFDSSRKRMTTIHNLTTPLAEASRVSFTKGAPKEMVALCTKICVAGEIRAMTSEDQAKIMQANDHYAEQGLRVLAVAYRDLGQVANLPKGFSQYTPELIEQDMIFMGLMVMADPPREEVAAAVQKCHDAHIRIIMVTGDYGLTAVSIAKRIGIVQGANPRVITGLELANISDEELKTALGDEVVFARVAPEQKYRVVSLLQDLGNVVAVTGDGVNDAPALKKADIGVAMGITGTDVAKESADMILTDDNFASIVRAVEEGRAVYKNIQKFLLYIFNSNMSEAVPSAAFLLSRAAIPLPLTVMQILAIDLGTDMIPALGLGVEEPEEGIMTRPPRTKKDALLTKGIIFKAFFWYGLMGAVVAMGAYFYTMAQRGVTIGNLPSVGVTYREATTMTLGAIIFTQIGAVWNCRTERASVFTVGPFKNKVINVGIVFEMALFCLLSYVPLFQDVFQTAPLGIKEWLFLLLCPVPIVAIEEVRKAYSRRQASKRRQTK